MKPTIALQFVAASTAAAQSWSTAYTATGTADVAAARATAKTSSPTSNVKGKAFDRLAIIWLENTNYDLANNDPNLDWLAKKGIKLTNHFGVAHPSEPNYVAVCCSSDAFNMFTETVH
jgi:acid phosphatase